MTMATKQVTRAATGGTLLLVALLWASASVGAQAPEQTAPASVAPAPATRPSKSPPQPVQKQGIDFFVGDWNFVWAGRETPLNAGPRSGTATFTRIGDSDFIEIRVEGKTEAGTLFKESAVAGWNAAQQAMAWHERFANGADAVSVAEWATPLALHFDVQPIRVGNATWRLRRTYNIGAAHSFDVIEELSVDGGPFQRLGKGEFTRKAVSPPR